MAGLCSKGIPQEPYEPEDHRNNVDRASPTAALAKPVDPNPVPENLATVPWGKLKTLGFAHPEILNRDDLPSKTKIWLAAELGLTKTVESAINSGKISLDELNDEQNRIVHVSADRGHVQLFRFVIEKDISQATAVNGHGELPIHLACQHGHTPVVQLLINLKVDLNICNHYGETPLYIASYNGRVEVVKLLCRCVKVRLTTANVDGISAIDIARSSGHMDLAQLLLRQLKFRRIRVLWIGNLKNQPNECALARLKPDVIRNVAKYMM